MASLVSSVIPWISARTLGLGVLSARCPLRESAIDGFGRGSNIAIQQVCATPQRSLAHLEEDVSCLASDPRDVTKQGDRVRVAAESRIDRRTR